MKPKNDIFADAVKKCRGNLTKVAMSFGVTRDTVSKWVKEDDVFRAAVNDSRMRLFDDCIAVSEVVAMGIPDKDAEGKLMGWKEKPDGNMLRYLMSTLGRSEGFGESLDLTSGGNSIAPRKVEINVVYNKKEDLEMQTRTETDTKTE